MYKKETNPQSSNQEEIKKSKREENHLLDVDRIKEIARFIADIFYEGRYTLERHTKSLYRFGFGISEFGDIRMFVGKTASEAMYLAIDSELASEIKLASRDELTKLADDRLATFQDEQRKRNGMEEDLAAKDGECKKLVEERDELKQEREAISNIIGRFTDKWKSDAVMQPFEKDVVSWNKKRPVLVAFLMETIEKLMYQLEDRPLRIEEERIVKEKALAVVNNTRILGSVWNDLQDKVLDGNWHAFSEADEIIRTHGYHELTLEGIRQKRGMYLRFAKDKKYHIARGEIDYLYERKSIKCVHKFRFTPVVEEVKPEKMVEKRLELGETVDRISNHPIHENPRDEFMTLFCDGKWHSSSEPIEMFKKYDKYNECKQTGFPALRSAYMRHVQKFYHKIKKREDGVYKFKFEKIRDTTEAIKLQNDAKCARCGQAIHYGKKCHQVDNLFYHPECYEVMEL